MKHIVLVFPRLDNKSYRIKVEISPKLTIFSHKCRAALTNVCKNISFHFRKVKVTLKSSKFLYSQRNHITTILQVLLYLKENFFHLQKQLSSRWTQLLKHPVYRTILYHFIRKLVSINVRIFSRATASPHMWSATARPSNNVEISRSKFQNATFGYSRRSLIQGSPSKDLFPSIIPVSKLGREEPLRASWHRSPGFTTTLFPRRCTKPIGSARVTIASR